MDNVQKITVDDIMNMTDDEVRGLNSRLAGRFVKRVALTIGGTVLAVWAVDHIAKKMVDNDTEN